MKMANVFAKNLSSKQVMATDGTEIGILFNIVMDIRTGDLIDLIVKPDMSLDTSKYKADEQYILLPFESVRAIKDYIVVDKNMARGLVTEPVNL
ncbi:Sporulation protein YlmC, PRC-barrel domain family [Methanolobus profundi]|uniref:Sporulation protein YlmC, PRC-barrel domain family n=2 Tax=Methanolobus profundi TaxID=487685 RepID=A0A1I4R3N9_9EURY|nr:Sporulation protein YlmC, PRC-barrel domain family [Methanolobus profundi]